MRLVTRPTSIGKRKSPYRYQIGSSMSDSGHFISPPSSRTAAEPEACKANRKRGKSIDTRPGCSYPQNMEVHFSADLQTKLSRLASEQGRDSETLVQEAVERMVNYDEWFLAEVDKGLAQIDSGQTLSHKEVGARLNKYLTQKQPPV